jgi:hypothetical protein
MSISRTLAAGPETVPGILAAEVKTMVIVTLIGLLALFSLLSIVLGSEDPRPSDHDVENGHQLWLRYGIR